MKQRGLQPLSMSFRLFQPFVLNSFFKLFSYDIVNWLQTCCVNAYWLNTDQVKISLLLINRHLSKYLFKCDSDLRSLFKLNHSEKREDGNISYGFQVLCLSIETPIIFMIGLVLRAISAQIKSHLPGPFRQAEIHP